MVNLTPHEIVFEHRDGSTTIIPPSGQVARVAAIQNLVYEEPRTKMPVVLNAYGEVEGLPEDESETYLVSLTVLNAAKGRKNVFAPDTGLTAKRHPNGQVRAVTRLVAAPES